MADAQGLKGKLAAVEVGSWTTAYTTPTALIPITSENIQESSDRIDDSTLEGSAARRASDEGNLSTPGPITADLDYNNFDLFFKLLFGDVTTRIFSFANITTAVFAWGETEIDQARKRFGPFMISKATISGEKGKQITANFDIFARERSFAATAFPGAALAGTRNRILFEELRFRIADHVDTLAAGDGVAIESFELEIDKNLKIDDYASDTSGTPANAKLPLQPVAAGFRSVKLKFKVPRFAATTIVDLADADSRIQAELYFVKSAESMKIQLPEGRFVGPFDPVLADAGPIVQEYELEFFRTESGNQMYTGNEAKITFV